MVLASAITVAAPMRSVPAKAPQKRSACFLPPQGDIQAKVVAAFRHGQYQPNVGPLPQGNYTILPPVNGGHTGLLSLPFVPDRNNNMGNPERGGFLIHGENRQHNRTASNGCIIMGPDIRQRIANSGDPNLSVVP